jgi:hypothetical protein
MAITPQQLRDQLVQFVIDSRYSKAKEVPEVDSILSYTDLFATDDTQEQVQHPGGYYLSMFDKPGMALWVPHDDGLPLSPELGLRRAALDNLVEANADIVAAMNAELTQEAQEVDFPYSSRDIYGKPAEELTLEEKASSSSYQSESPTPDGN